MNKELLRHIKMPLTVILLQFIFFPPLGFFLIYRRVAKSREYAGNNRAMIFSGWVLIALTIIPSIIGLMGNDIYRGNIGTYFLIWFLPGVYTLYRGNKITKYIKSGALYESTLGDSSTKTINTTEYNTVHVTEYAYSVNNTNKTPASYKVVTCSGCGAKKKVLAGGVDTCEFCDTPLKADE